MLTPQEVAEHAFQKASFGGYNMSMVDEFLDQVTADYTALYKENAALKAKMKVLADKVKGTAAQLYVSMENRMGCGVGACLVCSCKTNGGNKKVCKDGPVFRAEEVFGDE